MIRSIFKSKVPMLAVVACAAAGGFFVARAATPHTAPPPAPLFYTGFLSQDGLAVQNNPAQNLTVTLFDSATGTNMLCASTSNTVAVVAGQFSTQMGSGCHDALLTASAAFVEIAIDGTAISPRQQIGATPFSYSAEVAQSVPFTGISGIGSAAWPGTIKSSQIQHPRPSILGLTTVEFDGAGAPQNGSTGPGGYKGLNNQCVVDFGSDAFICSMADAAQSLARGEFGTTLPQMGTAGWVLGDAGADLDCSGFTSTNTAQFGTVFRYTTVNPPNATVIPQQVACNDTSPFVLCCGYP